jgi:hypothetical protein
MSLLYKGAVSMENRTMIQEGHLLAVFNSAHRVMKAEDFLKKLGLPVLLIPAPRALSTDCGLALRFGDEENNSIMRALADEELLPAFICRRVQGGTYETIWNNDGIQKTESISQKNDGNHSDS